jgi:hypothetical protein
MVVGSAIILAITGATVAIAASNASFTPKLGAPNGKRVGAGSITLTVKAKNAKTVYVWVRRNKKLKHGDLVECTATGKGCMVQTMKSKKKGVFTYKAPAYTFSGWWSTTPGKYYWQAQSFAKSPPCKYVTNGDCSFYSKVGSFTVR